MLKAQIHQMLGASTDNNQADTVDADFEVIDDEEEKNNLKITNILNQN